MLKPSLLGTVEQSLEDAEHRLEEVQTEDTIGEELIQFCEAKAPLTICSTEDFMSAMGISKEESSDDIESKLKSSKYTGFTIALKEEEKEIAQPRLSREPLTNSLKTLLVVDRNDEKAKEVEPLDFFSKTEVLRATMLEPDPNADPDSVWFGLEVATRKGDEDLNYYLISHEYGQWKVLDQTAEARRDSNGWLVQAAEIVRVKDRGPYIRLSIDEDHSVCFYPISPDLPSQRMHRFLTK